MSPASRGASDTVHPYGKYLAITRRRSGRESSHLTSSHQRLYFKVSYKKFSALEKPCMNLQDSLLNHENRNVHD